MVSTIHVPPSLHPPLLSTLPRSTLPASVSSHSHILCTNTWVSMVGSCLHSELLLLLTLGLPETTGQCGAVDSPAVTVSRSMVNSALNSNSNLLPHCLFVSTCMWRIVASAPTILLMLLVSDCWLKSVLQLVTFFLNTFFRALGSNLWTVIHSWSEFLIHLSKLCCIVCKRASTTLYKCAPRSCVRLTNQCKVIKILRPIHLQETWLQCQCTPSPVGTLGATSQGWAHLSHTLGPVTPDVFWLTPWIQRFFMSPDFFSDWRWKVHNHLSNAMNAAGKDIYAVDSCVTPPGASQGKTSDVMLTDHNDFHENNTVSSVM